MNRLAVVATVLITALLSVVAAGYAYDNATRNAHTAAQAAHDTTTLQVLGIRPNAHDSDAALQRVEAPGLGASTRLYGYDDDANVAAHAAERTRSEGAAARLPRQLLEASRASSGRLSAPRTTSWFGRSVDDLSAAAGVPGKGDLTAAGHALTKHATGQRAGSGAFPALRGGPGQINELAQFQVDDILTYPGSQFTQRTHPTFGNTLDVVAPDGQGVRFGSDGRFIGFLEP